MKRHIGILLSACLLLGLAPWTCLAQAPASTVVLVKVLPNKVRYTRGEAGTVQVTLRNTTTAEQAVTLEGDIAQELAVVAPLPPRAVTVPANDELLVELPFTAPRREYGCAVRVRVLQAGKEIGRAQDMFSVADNVWNVAQGAMLTIMDMSGRPWQNPAQDMQTARQSYFNWWEKMFWPPDDWGHMTPKEDSWYSGQGGRYEIKKVITDFITLANANGIASMTYGKSTAGGPAGWEIARRHPDWFKQDAAGRIIGTYNTDIFARWDSLPQFAGRDWYYLYPDLTNPVALDHGIDEILNSSVEYGWDGVRFDGDFTWVGSGEVAAFNQRRMKERIWAKLPNYVFGFNEGYGPPETDPATWPHSLRETLAGGGHWMNEGIRHYGYATNGVYASYQEYWQGMNRDANQLRQLGASYHLIYDAPRDLRGTYKVVLGTAAGAHPCYGDTAWIPGCANWGRYLTRWSAFVWDVNLRNRPDTDVEITAQSPLWHVIKERVADTKTTTTVVQLIVPPSTLDVKDEKVQVGPTAGPVMVRVRIPAGETVTRAAALAPEHPDEALALPVTRQGAWAVVTVPEVKLWTMVVFERAGAFTVPAYPKFTEPPDPAKVAEGRKTTGKLIRDPLRPDLPNPEAGAKVQVLEMEHIYQTCAKVEKDRDASGGACVRVDHTMSNSTVISHAVYRNVFPGHFRATYRMKLKSTTGDDGKPIWAGFGLYVYLGTKQLWLKEVEPKDFKTPGQYEDFTIEFDFLGEGSTITPSAFWRGQQAGGTIYVDKITLEQLSTYNDAQIAEKLKYVERIVQTPGGAPGLDVLVVNGLYHDKYRLPAALLQFGDVLDRTPQPAAAPAAPDAPKDAPLPAGDVYVTYATVDVTENDATLSGYPKTYEELCAYDVVVLVNADAAWFGFPGRAALRDYVKAGGGLLVLGGSATLGQGAFANTFLDEMLPVTVAAGRDIASTGKPLPLKPAATGLARALPAEVWQTPAYLYWRHLVRPKPEAQVHLSAGDAPVLFTGTYGQGRVAAFTGTVLGEPAGKEGPFWQWKGWPLLMHNALRWLAQMPAGK